MSQKQYLTAPVKTDKMPPGIPYIVGNEAAERFTFYGLRTILVVYMTKYLVDAQGNQMSDDKATEVYHLFQSSAYFFPILGAILADAFLGKYGTIMILSIIYSLGAAALAFVPGTTGLYLGLFLIALGTGGIKPCVSAHLGDQFGESNKRLITKAFGWFYFAINFGSLFSTFFTPIWLDKYGPKVAFGVPAFLMFLATFVFWVGRYKYIHIQPAGAKFVK
ncbi:MAG: MFS transporter, partial [Verrucomicrobiales bacterium]